MQHVERSRPAGTLPFALVVGAAILGVTLWQPPAALAAQQECKPALIAVVSPPIAQVGKIRPSVVPLPIASSNVAQRKQVQRDWALSGTLAVSYVRCPKFAG